jgi:hypothetical protein
MQGYSVRQKHAVVDDDMKCVGRVDPTALNARVDPLHDTEAGLAVGIRDVGQNLTVAGTPITELHARRGGSEGTAEEPLLRVGELV